MLCLTQLPGHMVHVVCQLPQSSPHSLLAHPLLGQLQTASPDRTTATLIELREHCKNQQLT